MAKYLSLYGNRAGTCLSLQSPTAAQLKIFKAVLLSETQHSEYISSSKEDREVLLEQYRLANPSIVEEKKKIIPHTVREAAPVAVKEKENKVEEKVEIELNTEIQIEVPTEIPTEIVTEIVTEVVAKKTKKKTKK